MDFEIDLRVYPRQSPIHTEVGNSVGLLSVRCQITFRQRTPLRQIAEGNLTQDKITSLQSRGFINLREFKATDRLADIDVRIIFAVASVFLTEQQVFHCTMFGYVQVDNW